jgi:hypothetical protein
MWNSIMALPLSSHIMRRPIVKFSTIALLLGGMLLAAAQVAAQQPETGPKSSKDGHPLRTEETGTRGPSGGSPDTGYHGPRDVTKDAEPGKAGSPEELRKESTGKKN